MPELAGDAARLPLSASRQATAPERADAQAPSHAHRRTRLPPHPPPTPPNTNPPTHTHTHTPTHPHTHTPTHTHTHTPTHPHTHTPTPVSYVHGICGPSSPTSPSHLAAQPAPAASSPPAASFTPPHPTNRQLQPFIQPSACQPASQPPASQPASRPAISQHTSIQPPNVRRRPPQSPPNNQHPATVVGRHPVNNKQLARVEEAGRLIPLSDYGVWKRLYARGAV